MSVRVVLIDSGVNARHPHLSEHGRVVLGPSVRDDGSLDFEAEHVDLLGHGTAAAAAILDLAGEIELVSVRVFERTPTCPFERVLGALRHALELRPALVNLSLGTTDERWRAELEQLGRQFVAARVRVVSPALQQGLPSLPGALPDYTGVVVDARLPRAAPVERREGAQSLWYASPYPRPLPGLAPARNLSGVSLATANVTGFLARRPGEDPESA